MAVLIIFLGLLSAFSPSAQRGEQNGELSLEVLLLDLPTSPAKPRIWMKITNRSTDALMLCRQGWNYAWIPGDSFADVGGEAHRTFEGCGDDDHDPYWMLLPGQSRFDSFQSKTPLAGKDTLRVEVELLYGTVGRGEPSARKRLSWEGPVVDAVAAGRQVRRAQ